MTNKSSFHQESASQQKAAFKSTYADFQDDNMVAGSKDFRAELMDTNMVQGREGREVSLKKNASDSKSGSMQAEERHSKEQTFSFNAKKIVADSGGESKIGKKWKRAARTLTKERSGHSSLVSGKKRGGLKDLGLNERKKSREDGEIGPESISEFNTPQLAEMLFLKD
ncbi:hypothetical protein COLO4_20931 [Corchorus olitorius]|uniref:Uncharacterized protein n=1 Tax=Corchorus olitorius TaxID=93759 RepID=A0A1R3IW32_9ROSI|nr:hypothetical protein COLO4_20931 [Corchorus olitorius]